MNVNDSCSLTFLWYVKNNAVVLNNPRGLLRSLLSFFFLFLNRHPSRAIWAGMFWYAAVTDKNTAQPVFSFISPTSLYFFLTTSTPFFMKRRDSVCFIFPPSLVFFFGFFFIPLCGGDNKQSPMCQFGTHPRLVDVCSISKTLAVSGFGPINNRIRKKKPGPDSATTLYLFIQ